MTPHELKAKLSSGQRVYGTSIISSSPRWPEVVAKIGLDFVFLDTEHTPVDRERLSWMCHSYRGFGLPPLVRIPAPDPYQACMVLDGGASGIIVPYVETAAQARELSGAVKFRPLKGARLREALDNPGLIEPKLLSYLKAENAGNLLVLNIESVPAMNSLDEILAVPGIDAVLIGPHDLSCSLGVPEDYECDLFETAVTTILRRARAKGVAAGIHAFMGLEREAVWGRAGANLMVHEADIRTFARTAKSDIRWLRDALDRENGRQGSVRDGTQV